MVQRHFKSARVIPTSLLLAVSACMCLASSHSKRAEAQQPTVNEAPSAHNSEVEAEIRELDQIQGKAWLDRDQETLKRLWSPEFVLQAPSNQILTREGVFREMQTPRLAGGLASMERTTERVTQFGDIVISMGMDRPENKTGPTAGIVRTQRYTNVWRREGNSWRMIARHAHLLPLDPGQLPATPNTKPE